MKVSNTIFGLIAAVLLTACGSQSITESSARLSGQTGNTGGSQTGNNNDNNNGNGGNLYPASVVQVTLGGQSSSIFKKDLFYSGTNGTSRTLRVKIKPLPAPNLDVPGYTNWVFPYGCLSVSVTVNGMTRGTQVLRVEGVSQPSSSLCKDAPTSQILDFTDVMSGTGDTMVTISNANYDNCRGYNNMIYGCSMSAVWQNHRAAMEVVVQKDGEYMP